jgi:CheY-like chemotaxis protein
MTSNTAHPIIANGKSILIADDNEINILLLGFMLDELNYTYDTAVDGSEALSLLVSQSYQIALIDLNMPVMNGIELIKLLRNKKNSTPCIAISANANQETISEAISAGFNAYITKPFDEIQLNQLINNYI